MTAKDERNAFFETVVWFFILFITFAGLPIAMFTEGNGIQNMDDWVLVGTFVLVDLVIVVFGYLVAKDQFQDWMKAKRREEKENPKRVNFSARETALEQAEYDALAEERCN